MVYLCICCYLRVDAQYNRRDETILADMAGHDLCFGPFTAQYSVSPSGSDLNSGSITQPFLTI
jgi:hypothetical protein